MKEFCKWLGVSDKTAKVVICCNGFYSNDKYNARKYWVTIL